MSFCNEIKPSYILELLSNDQFYDQAFYLIKMWIILNDLVDYIVSPYLEL